MLTELKRRSDLHWARKAWHISTVCLMAFVYTHVSWWVSISLLLVLGVLFIPLDILRQTRPKLNETLVPMFKVVIRENEVHHMAGTTFLLIGVFIVVLIFPPPVTTLTLLFLAIGDPIASFVGILYGKDKIVRSKSLQGTVAALVVCFLISVLYFSSQNMVTGRLLLVSLLTGLAGAISELIPLWRLDDNLTFPLLSATSLWIILSHFCGQDAFCRTLCYTTPWINISKTIQKNDCQCTSTCFLIWSPPEIFFLAFMRFLQLSTVNLFMPRMRLWRLPFLT